MSKRPFIYSPNNMTGTIIEKAILINGIDYDFYGVVPPRRNQLTNGIDGGIVLLGYEGNKFSLNIFYKKSFLYGMNNSSPIDYETIDEVRCTFLNEFSLTQGHPIETEPLANIKVKFSNNFENHLGSTIEGYKNFRGYRLTDDGGWIWAEFGTLYKWTDRKNKFYPTGFYRKYWFHFNNKEQ